MTVKNCNNLERVFIEYLEEKGSKKEKAAEAFRHYCTACTDSEENILLTLFEEVQRLEVGE